MLFKESLEALSPKNDDMLYIDFYVTFMKFYKSKIKSRKEWDDMHVLITEYSELKKSKEVFDELSGIEVEGTYKSPLKDGYVIILKCSEDVSTFKEKIKGKIAQKWQATI